MLESAQELREMQDQRVKSIIPLGEMLVKYCNRWGNMRTVSGFEHFGAMQYHMSIIKTFPTPPQLKSIFAQPGAAAKGNQVCGKIDGRGSGRRGGPLVGG